MEFRQWATINHTLFRRLSYCLHKIRHAQNTKLWFLILKMLNNRSHKWETSHFWNFFFRCRILRFSSHLASIFKTLFLNPTSSRRFAVHSISRIPSLIAYRSMPFTRQSDRSPKRSLLFARRIMGAWKYFSFFLWNFQRHTTIRQKKLTRNLWSTTHYFVRFVIFSWL